ncbi:MAG: alpha/beta hydrolase [Hellea sp.]|nr:alpha/beta hydrolase [Hellea sp.]
MRRMIYFLIILVMLLGGTFYAVLQNGAASTAVLNFITPSKTFERETDLSFGDHARDKFDFYEAAEGGDDNPLLVFIHGGGWNSGDKKMYKFLAEGLTAEGYDVALPNYRLYPEVKYPAFLDDNARAIAAIHKQHPTRYLVLIGHSAGAYNVLKMGVKPEYLRAAGIESCYTVKGIVGLASPTGGYPAKSEPTISIFPNRIQGEEAPLNHTDQALPPIMLVHGTADVTVRYENAVKMADNLGDRATLKLYEDADHTDPIKQFSRRFKGPIRDDVVAFIEGLPDDEGDGFCN